MKNLPKKGTIKVKLNSRQAVTKLLQLMFEFDTEDPAQIRNLTRLLSYIDSLDNSDVQVSRQNITKFLGGVIATLGGDPAKLASHAAIVKECTRLFQSDELWHRAIAKNKSYAKSFNLSALINSGDRFFRTYGEQFAALMMVKVQGLETYDIADDDTSIDRINQALLKFVISNQAKIINQGQTRDATKISGLQESKSVIQFGVNGHTRNFS